jgi:hypothetical protein
MKKKVTFGRHTQPFEVEIPISGKIPRIEEDQNVRYDNFAKYPPRRDDEDCIVIAIPYEELREKCEDFTAEEARLYWVGERKEWVAFHFFEWYEGWRGYDFWANGPYSIVGTQWVQKIREAFGIEDTSLSEEDILQSNPKILTGRSNEKH